MTEIVPAIMPVSFTDLREKLAVVKDLVTSVQIDVMDGKFVPERNWPMNESPNGPFAQILREEDGLPFWNEIDFEADLMVSDPASAIDAWAVAGAKRVIVHVESTSDFGALLRSLRERFPKDVVGDSITIEIGAALNTTTSNDAVYPFLDELDFVQFMGIEKIGYQGQPFDERVLGKIGELRAMRPEYIISVDGAVNLETAPRLVAAGANRLAVGSFLLRSSNVAETIELLKNC